MFFYRKPKTETEAARQKRTWVWKQRFAFFPVRVEMRDGKIGYVLFDFFESRYKVTDESDFGYEMTIERRRLGVKQNNYTIRKLILHPPL